MRKNVTLLCMLLPCGIVGNLVLTVPSLADTQVFTIVDDAALNQAIAQARANFLSIKPYVSRLDVTILVPDPAQPGT
ncbi:MAG: hypothetical protein JW809_16490, partial [Pirellulales bacterium]|nr:hypothetical protein [Pirellulales bacterium]